MLELVHEAAGEVLRPVKRYLDDSNQYWTRINRFDKLERKQTFSEPYRESWRLFAAGRWRESLIQIERDRPEVVAEFAEDARIGYTSHRVRVVELPITPYLQWEMNYFRARVACGEDIRIVGPDTVSAYETDGAVPELIFMGKHAMYEVLYDSRGELAGGRKFIDPDLVEGCLTEVQSLHSSGEDFWTFFEREVAPLPPPTVNTSMSSPAGP